jgi:hypothetical protein
MSKRLQTKTIVASSVLALLMFLMVSIPAIHAQEGSAIAPIGNGTVDVASREEADIDNFVPSPLPSIPPSAVPFRPTMGQAEYLNAKQAAGIAADTVRAGANAPSPALPVIAPVSFPGGLQTDNTTVGQPLWYPPDVAGAPGSSQYVQVHNSYIRVYAKGTGALVATKSLAALMGYTAQSLFDPRVQWDPIWNRWVITAIAFAESTSVQRFFIAVSKSSSASGAYWVYNTNTVSFTAPGAFWDYASLGMDQDGLIFTANVFGTSTFLGAYTFALSKAQAYNGRSQGFAVFGGLASTLQPPIVTKAELNGYAWLAAAPSGSGTIKMYAMRDSSRPNATALFGPYTVTGVAAYSIPPNAPQPGCAAVLDTSDNRFVNAGTQVGDKYYQVHTIALGAAAVRYYVISGLNSFAPTVAESGTFYSSGASSDFNPAIAANAAGDLVMTYSRSDASNFAQVRAVGRTNGSAAISGTGGAPVTFFSSSVCLTGNGGADQRWGDYSQVNYDPSSTQSTNATKKFWITNQKVAGASTWGTQFGSVHF